MVKALRGEAVVLLPRISNNADHGCLRLALGVKTFQRFTSSGFSNLHFAEIYDDFQNS
jgi:hypothetical protein